MAVGRKGKNGFLWFVFSKKDDRSEEKSDVSKKQEALRKGLTRGTGDATGAWGRKAGAKIEVSEKRLFSRMRRRRTMVSLGRVRVL